MTETTNVLLLAETDLARDLMSTCDPGFNQNCFTLGGHQYEQLTEEQTGLKFNTGNLRVLSHVHLNQQACLD